jgi:ABC-2 type transport system ATP-binding protein
MKSVIEVSHLTKVFGDERGIIDLNLSCKMGEIFGFLGPNGSGKTTTIRTFLDLLHPDKGYVKIFGLDSHKDSRAIRARTGNLPGGFTYEKQMTGNQMLKLFADLRGMNGIGQGIDLADRLNADLDRPLGQLSHGNLQKIGLIQALFHEPELLILDEPTIGLDPLMQEEFLKILREQRDKGTTVFLSSHDLSEVERICDRVCVIRQARLVAIDDIKEMHHKSARNVTIDLAEDIDCKDLGRINGVVDLVLADRKISFKMTHNANAIIKKVADYEISDIQISHPTLEELFMTYYTEHKVKQDQT